MIHICNNWENSKQKQKSQLRSFQKDQVWNLSARNISSVANTMFVDFLHPKPELTNELNLSNSDDNDLELEE